MNTISTILKTKKVKRKERRDRGNERMRKTCQCIMTALSSPDEPLKWNILMLKIDFSLYFLIIFLKHCFRSGLIF